MHKHNILLILLVYNFSLTVIATIDNEQTIFYQDFGPNGIKGPYNVTLTSPMRPGSVVSVVTKSNKRCHINLLSDDIYVIHVDSRIAWNEFIINTSKRLMNEWMPKEVRLTNPVLKGAKTTTTLVYELEGYRIFVNGKELFFYPHRTEKVPKVIHPNCDYIYQIMYLTTEEYTSS